MATSRRDDTSVNLLARIQSGDRDAWLRLTRLYGPLLRHWCRRWGVADAELDDLSQEIWLAIGPTMRGFRPTPGSSFRAWLRGVARNKAMHWHRRRGREPAEAEGGSVAVGRLHALAAGDDGQDDPAELALCRAIYRRALDSVRGQFEDRTWRAFCAFVIEGTPAADVGAELGLSAASVRMAKSRVLHRLRLELGDLVDGRAGSGGDRPGEAPAPGAAGGRAAVGHRSRPS